MEEDQGYFLPVVSLNSIQQFQTRLRTCLCQSEARVAIFVFRLNKIHKQGRGCWAVASCQVLSNVRGCRENIVAAFRGMQVSPAKHSYAWLPRKCDYQTDRHIHKYGQTDAGQSDPYVPLCFAGDTKKCLSQSEARGPSLLWQTENVIPMWCFASLAPQWNVFFP